MKGSLPRLGLFAVLLIVGATIAGAAIVHGFQIHRTCAPETDCQTSYRPGWADPIALAVLVIGISAAAGVLLMRRSSS
jgi:hypothetical protein